MKPALYQRFICVHGFNPDTCIITKNSKQVEFKTKYTQLILSEILDRKCADKYASVVEGTTEQGGYQVSHRALWLLMKKNYVCDELMNAFLV